MRTCGECDLIIEAATENVDLKLRIVGGARFGREARSDHRVEHVVDFADPHRCRDHAASQVVGMHFFNPVPLMKLVELIRAAQTSDATCEAVKALAQRIGKTPVEVRNSPGFVANRVLLPMLNEAVFCLHEGIASAEDIDRVMKLGMAHPMGPLALADLIGLDVCLSILEVLHQGFGDPKYRPCPLWREKVEARELGRKTGRGFFDYGSSSITEAATMDAPVLSAVSAVVGSIIGLSASVATTWVSQRTQLRRQAIARGDQEARGALRRIHHRMLEARDRRARSFAGQPREGPHDLCAPESDQALRIGKRRRSHGAGDRMDRRAVHEGEPRAGRIEATGARRISRPRKRNDPLRPFSETCRRELESFGGGCMSGEALDANRRAASSGAKRKSSSSRSLSKAWRLPLLSQPLERFGFEDDRSYTSMRVETPARMALEHG